MSINIYVVKSDEQPITADEVKAAVSKAPHYSLTDDGMVEVPIAGGNAVWLEPTGSGSLSFQMLAGHDEYTEQIVDAIRRFAGCIPGAVVDAEGEILDPLPWDQRPSGGAR